MIMSLSMLTLAASTVFAEESPTGKTAAQAAAESESAPPTPDEQVTMMEAQCAASEKARSERHAKSPLYERLGGEKKIHALTQELVKLHLQNKDVAYLFEDLDGEMVAKRVAEFMISNTGGPTVYEGPDLTTSHAHMHLTNADFMAAGADVIQAMKNMGYGQEEIDEVVCALVGLRELVVLPDHSEKGHHDHGKEHHQH
jgi:truncated hemoglobin YjbI